VVLNDLRGDDDVGLAFWSYRGFYASDGTPTPEALKSDLAKQWQRLQELGATADRTEVWSYSLGSTFAPHLVADMCTANQAPQRLVLLATGIQIAGRPLGLLGRFKSSDIDEGVSAKARVTCPVTIAHGSADDAMQIYGAKKLAKTFGARMVVLEGKGHIDLWQDARRELWGK
jgi:pimeloyl-ACP methyl ester carboxylesterase